MYYKLGQERNVNWYWTNTLGIRLQLGNNIDIPAHPLHQPITGNDGQIFYGGYTLVAAGTHTFSKSVTFHPTLKDHTEPQYFAWLEAELAPQAGGLQALLIEICQTNTPCSAPTCRPFILNCIQARSIGTVNLPNTIVIARMSARVRYESSAAGMVSLTSGDYDAIKGMKAGNNILSATPLTLQNGAALHQIPYNF